MPNTIYKFKILVAALLVSVSNFLVIGQVLEGKTPDKIYMHVNKPFFAIGETIWYKAYFFNTNVVKSKVLYIDLISPSGKPIIRQKLKIEGNSASGDIQIPLNTKEGAYHLAAYTKWNENFGQNFQSVFQIPIFEDWNSSWDPENKTPSLPEFKLPKQDHLLAIETDKSEYLVDQKINLNIEIFDTENQIIDGNLSISVLKDDAAHGYDLSGILERFQSYRLAGPVEGTYTIEPETELSLTGTIFDPKTEATVSSGLISIHKVSDHNFLRTTSNDGIINMKLPDFYGKDEVQIINLNTFQQPEPRFELSEYQQDVSINTSTITRTAAVERYLYLSRLRKKLNDVFYDDSETMGTGKPDLGNLSPDRTFYMKDYQLIKDLREFIDEAIVVARVREEDGKAIIRLFNADTKQYFVEKPWYLLNGYLIDNEQAILKIPLGEIEKIELYSSSESIISQFEPVMIKNGVIAVYTNDGKTWSHLNIPGNNVPIEGFHKPNAFTRSDITKNEDKVPNFDPVIHWEPYLMTENGKASISFPVGQSPGKYVILVEGISTDGSAISGLKTYRVDLK